MPCDSSYMEPSNKEKEISKVAALLDELDSGELNMKHYKGMHPIVYNQGLSEEQCDTFVRTLCHKLTTEEDVNEYSLEMQIWWRDHKIADEKRKLREEESKYTYLGDGLYVYFTGHNYELKVNDHKNPTIAYFEANHVRSFLDFVEQKEKQREE